MNGKRPFLLLLLLFAVFRLLSLVLFRPGGFITDFSDYDFYYEWGVLPAMGYVAFDNLWTAYPPLFPALMLTLYEWSARIPPWVEPRLFFHLIFGAAMLLFECGNFICVYWLGRRLAQDEQGSVENIAENSSQTFVAPRAGVDSLPPGLWPAILYGFLFTPVYTMLGWFEPMPLFFMLAGLCLLLHSPAGRYGAGILAGLGFLTKLTPILLLPIGVRLFGARLSLQAAKAEWFRPGRTGNLLGPLLYLLIFAAVVIGIGYPLVGYNLELAFASFQVQNIRPPWQSIWALIDGYYGWGLVPLSMRNLEGLTGSLWESSIPWAWISTAFVGLYLYFYTRAYDWQRIRTPIAFAGFSVTLLFLYSKGWSPQFLVWILVFIVLLTPTARWLAAGVVLAILNVIESSIYVIMLPQETYLLFGTVILRTILLILFAAELLLQIWPHRAKSPSSAAPPTRRRVAQFQAVAVWATLGIALIAGGLAFPRAATAYQSARLAEHSCRDTVLFLQENREWPQPTLVTQQPDIWREFYPWLHQSYHLAIIDGYDTQDRYIETAIDRLDQQIDAPEFWWLARVDLGFPGSSPPEVREHYFTQAGVHLLEERHDGPCRLYRLADLGETSPIAFTPPASNPSSATIFLWAYAQSQDEIAGDVRLVLYWQAETAVNESYTVFVHLFDESGTMIGQQDNLPVEGLAPTTHWTPGALIRDPYHIVLSDGTADHEPARPPDRQPVRAHIGLYSEAGRVQFEHPNGDVRDHVEIVLNP